MTVAAELAKASHRMEYILCIEGIGWPRTESDLSDGFYGDVFVTDDLDGTLAVDIDDAAVGLTIHKGLMVRSTLTDRVDPVSGIASLGGLSVEIVDYDSWWTENFTPHAVSELSTISTVATAYSHSQVYVADGTGIDVGDTIWVGGREAVYCATKTLSGGTEYYYTGFRGYLGTPRGRTNSIPSDASAFSWAIGTPVYDGCRFFHDRYCELYAHVPGEAPENCLRLWSGKLRGVSFDNVGTTVRLQMVGDVVRDVSRVWRAREMTCSDGAVEQGIHGGLNNGVGAGDYDNPLTQAELGWLRKVKLTYDQNSNMAIDGEGKYVVASGYRYRTEPGGTAGMRSAWDAGNVQALDSSNGEDEKCIMRYMQVGDRVYLAKKANDTSAEPEFVAMEAWSSLGGNVVEPSLSPETGQPVVPTFKADTKCRWLLDNWQDTWEFNHYAVNKRVTRNPIDMFLCHLLSRDDEYFVGDTVAGSIISTVKWGATISDPGYDGAAVFCVEGSNKGESRTIASVSTDTATVEDNWSNIPGTSEEYQIRNTVYDTLPVGWGLGVPWYRVDVDSFETVRDRFLSDAKVGKFVLGTQDKVNLFEMLQQNVLQPYGVYLYIDRTTGKLSADYLGQAMGDGVITDYVAVSDSQVIEIGEVDYSIEKPVGTVNVKVRALEEHVVSHRAVGTVKHVVPGYLSTAPRPDTEPVYRDVPAQIGGETTNIEHKLKGFEAFTENNRDELELSALFNTTEDVGAVSARCQAILKTWAVPPPTTDITISPSLIPSVRAGSFLVVTKDDGPINPYLGTRGWNQVVCFVTGTQLMIMDGPSLKVSVLILSDLNGGKVAPASKLDGALSGSDGTSDYFVVEPAEYVSDTANEKDYHSFVVGDRLTLFDEDGSAYAGANPGPYTIRSFGANDVSDPTQASTDIIRIDQTAPAAGGISANHYLSFQNWSASNTARMEKFAAYATSAGALTGGDTARRWV